MATTQITDSMFVDDTLTVATEDGRLVEVDVMSMAGPGVWRRVLAHLEDQGIEDRGHVLLAWELNLIGPWHY